MQAMQESRELTLHESVVQCCPPMEWQSAGQWSHAAADKWPLSRWAEEKYVLRVNWEGLTQYTANQAPMFQKHLWRLPAANIRGVSVYHHGRIDIRFVEVESYSGDRGLKGGNLLSSGVGAPGEGEEHQMVLLCRARDSAAAWRLSDAITAATSSPLSIPSAVDDIQALRLLFKPWVKWTECPHTGATSVQLLTENETAAEEGFISSFLRDKMYRYKLAEMSKPSCEMSAEELVSSDAQAFVRQCVRGLQVSERQLQIRH